MSHDSDCPVVKGKTRAASVLTANARDIAIDTAHAQSIIVDNTVTQWKLALIPNQRDV